MPNKQLRKSPSPSNHAEHPAAEVPQKKLLPYFELGAIKNIGSSFLSK